MWTLAKIASEIGAKLIGDADKVITGVGTLQNATDTDISFWQIPNTVSILILLQQAV